MSTDVEEIAKRIAGCRNKIPKPWEYPYCADPICSDGIERAIRILADFKRAVQEEHASADQKAMYDQLDRIRELAEACDEAIEARDFAEEAFDEECAKLESHCSTCPRIAELEELKRAADQLYEIATEIPTDDTQDDGWIDRLMIAAEDYGVARALIPPRKE